MRHSLVAKFKSPMSVEQFRVKMLFERHFVASLGRFRISVTTSKGDVRALKVDRNVESLLAKRGAKDWSNSQRELIARDYLTHSPNAKEVRNSLERIKKRIAQRTYTLVMSERAADNPRATHRHHRGEYLSPRERVDGRIPAIFSKKEADAAEPKNRLELARWLVSEQNPLFARVVVNRAWRHFWGKGIVRSDGDFGTQAAPPTHPQLLDWLAADFIESGMSLKNLHRQIVLSAAYQQHSSASATSRMDPGNELFARGPRHRLEGETIRDIYLHAGDSLSTRIGGPSVKPPQPASVMAVAWGNPRWNTSTGEDRFRRSLYTFSKRTAPFAAFQTFDAPSGETCVAVRNRSNTPLQALTLLNDAMFVEFAQRIGASVYDVSLPAEEQIQTIFRRLLARPASEQELRQLLRYYQAQLKRIAAGELSAEQICGRKERSNEIAALVMSARVVMNLDEAITKQ